MTTQTRLTYQAVLDCPIADGATRIGICSQAGFIQALDLVSPDTALIPASGGALQRLADQLHDYFEGRGSQFDVSLQVDGTAFQQRVWRYLCGIPWGGVRSYGEVARALDTSARAVGNACRNNPVPLLVPCHRVVSASGPGGYLGATRGNKLNIKAWLLAHERSA